MLGFVLGAGAAVVLVVWVIIDLWQSGRRALRSLNTPAVQAEVAQIEDHL
jgi:hypothetical protein